MFRAKVFWITRLAQTGIAIFTFVVLTGCLPDRPKRINPEDFFQSLENQGVPVSQSSPDQFSNLQSVVPGNHCLGVYQTDEEVWALYDLPVGKAGDTDLFSVSNLNLTIYSEKEIPQKVADCLVGLTPKIGYEQLGIFAYPLGAC